jgi:hypothetical protein
MAVTGRGDRCHGEDLVKLLLSSQYGRCGERGRGWRKEKQEAAAGYLSPERCIISRELRHRQQLWWFPPPPIAI